jgi:hypothetical protein
MREFSFMSKFVDDALIRLANALAEDVLRASEGEILAEACDNKIDVELVASARRMQFESIAATIAKRFTEVSS